MMRDMCTQVGVEVPDGTSLASHGARYFTTTVLLRLLTRVLPERERKHIAKMIIWYLQWSEPDLLYQDPLVDGIHKVRKGDQSHHCFRIYARFAATYPIFSPELETFLMGFMAPAIFRIGAVPEFSSLLEHFIQATPTVRLASPGPQTPIREAAVVPDVTPLSPGRAVTAIFSFDGLEAKQRKDKLRDLLKHDEGMYSNIPEPMQKAVPRSLVFNLEGDFCTQCLVPAHTTRQGRWRFLSCEGRCGTSCHQGCVIRDEDSSSSSTPLFRCDSCSESVD
jgi:hypothetical protein